MTEAQAAQVLDLLAGILTELRLMNAIMDQDCEDSLDFMVTEGTA